MQCIQCGETNINKFYPSSLKRSDFRCERCVLEYSKNWRKRHLEKANETWKRYYPKYYTTLKQDIFSHYSNGEMECAECGAADKLSIDHINGDGYKHRQELGFKSSYQFYLWLKKNNYPEGYRVLCIHCNSHIRKTRGIKRHHTGKFILQNMNAEIYQAREIAKWGEPLNISERAILEALRRLLQKGNVIRISKGLYKSA